MKINQTNSGDTRRPASSFNVGECFKQTRDVTGITWMVISGPHLRIDSFHSVRAVGISHGRTGGYTDNCMVYPCEVEATVTCS